MLANVFPMTLKYRIFEDQGEVEPSLVVSGEVVDRAQD
jgi:hypothetical protein